MKAAYHIGVILTRLAGRKLGLLLITGFGDQSFPCDGELGASCPSAGGVSRCRISASTISGFGANNLVLALHPKHKTDSKVECRTYMPLTFVEQVDSYF